MQGTRQPPYQLRRIIAFNGIQRVDKTAAAKGTPAAVEHAQVLFALADRLGLLYQNPSEFLQGGEGDIDSSQIEKLIADRKQARADKDWVLADAIRDKLAQKGIEILDSADGTTWRKK